MGTTEKQKEILKRSRTKDPIRRLLNVARNRATKRNLDFNLERSDINIPEFCPYLKIPLNLRAGLLEINFAPSLDRIDNTKGYIKGNIEVISVLANKMKNIATKEQLILFAKSILEKYNE